MSEESNVKNDSELLHKIASLPGSSATRRSFLKKATAAGVLAVGIYVAPQFSTVTARRAYAGITGGSEIQTPSVVLAKNPVESGEFVVASFAGFTPFSRVTFSASGVILRAEYADASGVGNANTSINLPAGEHTFHAEDAAGLSADTPISVTAVA